MRTQITLNDEELELLDRAGQGKSGASRSELDPSCNSHRLRKPEQKRTGGSPTTKRRRVAGTGLYRCRLRRRHSRQPRRSLEQARLGVKLVDTTIAVDHLRGVPAAVELLTGLTDAGEDLSCKQS